MGDVATLKDRLTLALHGEASATEALLSQLEPLLFRCAWRFKPFSMEIDDAMQECRLAFVYALRHYRTCHGGAFTGYLTACCKSQFVNEKRKLARRLAIATVCSYDAFDVPPTDHVDRFAAPLARALLAAVMDQEPPPERARQALRVVLTGQSMRETSRNLSIHHGVLAQALRNWSARVRRRFGFEP